MEKLKRKTITQGIIMSILPGAFAVGGTVEALTGDLMPGAIFALFGVGFLVLLWSQLQQGYARMRHMQERNFDWYRASYPAHLRNGRVTCHNCSCDRINVRALMRRTYMREHVCTQCGETLYYSPEGLAAL